MCVSQTTPKYVICVHYVNMYKTNKLHFKLEDSTRNKNSLKFKIHG